MKCKCGRNWRWNWEQDCYQYDDGTMVIEKELHTSIEGKGEPHHPDAYWCVCECGAVNAVCLDNEHGLFVLHDSDSEWAEVDWQSPENMVQ